jgi:hypothetical protein
VPILEWAGSGVLNTIVQDNLTEWASVGTITTGFLSASTTAPTLEATSTARWRRVGDTLHLNAALSFTNANEGSGTYQLILPFGLTLDTSKINTGISAHQFGTGTLWGNANTEEQAVVVIYSSSQIRFFYQADLDGTTNDITSFASGSPAGAVTRSLYFQAEFPITQWAGSQSSLVGFSQASDTAMGLLSYYKTATHATTWTFNGGGSAGSSYDQYITRIGNVVTVSILGRATSGTGSTSMTTDTALPAWARPPGDTLFYAASGYNNGAADNTNPYRLSISSAGVISVTRHAAVAFTNATVCGLNVRYVATYIIP